jgi:hypothetical protein
MVAHLMPELIRLPVTIPVSIPESYIDVADDRVQIAVEVHVAENDGPGLL